MQTFEMRPVILPRQYKKMIVHRHTGLSVRFPFLELHGLNTDVSPEEVGFLFVWPESDDPRVTQNINMGISDLVQHKTQKEVNIAVLKTSFEYERKSILRTENRQFDPELATTLRPLFLKELTNDDQNGRIARWLSHILSVWYASLDYEFLHPIIPLQLLGIILGNAEVEDFKDEFRFGVIDNYQQGVYDHQQVNQIQKVLTKSLSGYGPKKFSHLRELLKKKLSSA